MASTFYYTAMKTSGSKAIGFRTAASRDKLSEQLKSDGLLLLSARRLPFSIGSDATSTSGSRNAKRIPLKDEFALNEQLAVLVGRGVPLTESLEVVRGVVSKKSAPLVESIREQVLAGTSFADACAQTGSFDSIAVGVYKAAERSGDLAGAATRLATATKRRLAIRAKALTVTIYPSFIMLIAVFVLGGVLILLVPTLAEQIMQTGADLPLLSRIVFDTSLFLKGNLPSLLLGVAALLAIAVGLRSSVGATARSVALKFKPTRELMRSAELSRFFAILAAMTRTGVPLADALQSANAAIAEPKLKHQLESLRDKLVQGSAFGRVVDEVDLLPIETRKLLIAAERSGDLDTAFDALAERLAELVDTSSARVLALLEPAIFLLIFVVLAPVILGITTALMSMRTTL